MYEKQKTAAIKNKRGSALSAASFNKQSLNEFLEDTLSHHGIGNLLEAHNVSTSNQVIAQAIALGNLNRRMIDILHDALQLLVNFLEAPGEALAVLAHLERGGCHAAGVGSLAR